MRLAAAALLVVTPKEAIALAGAQHKSEAMEAAMAVGDGTTAGRSLGRRAEIWGASVVRGRASPARQPDMDGSRSIDTINRIMTSHVG